MIPYKESSTAEDLTYIFLRIIASIHSVPTEIISDRDKLFTSKFWQTLTALLGIKRKLSTAFHPQTDGQMERLNQTIE
jgi:transposase InsO family protein